MQAVASQCFTTINELVSTHLVDIRLSAPLSRVYKVVDKSPGLWAGQGFPVPGSRFPVPGSRFPVPGSRFPVPGATSPPWHGHCFRHSMVKRIILLSSSGHCVVNSPVAPSPLGQVIRDLRARGIYPINPRVDASGVLLASASRVKPE